MKLATFRSSSTKRMRMAITHIIAYDARAVYRAAFAGGEQEILLKIIANNLPTLHDEFYALQLGDVTQRVSSNGNDVRELSFLNGADAILPAHHLGRDGGGGLNG